MRAPQVTCTRKLYMQNQTGKAPKANLHVYHNLTSTSKQASSTSTLLRRGPQVKVPFLVSQASFPGKFHKCFLRGQSRSQLAPALFLSSASGRLCTKCTYQDGQMQGTNAAALPVLLHLQASRTICQIPLHLNHERAKYGHDWIAVMRPDCTKTNPFHWKFGYALCL